MIHVTVGDLISDRFQTLNLPGTIFTYRENHLIGEPGDESERARFLAEANDIDVEQVLNTLQTQRDALSSVANEEIVIWFESDLYDYLCIQQIIDILNHSEYRKLNSIYVAWSPINLMRLSASELIDLFENRIELSEEVTSRLLSELTTATRRFLTPHHETGLTGIEALVKEVIGDQRRTEINIGATLNSVQQILGEENFLTDVQLKVILKKLAIPLLLIFTMITGWSCSGQPSESVAYKAIMKAATNRDTLIESAALDTLRQWANLESEYPDWGRIVGDSTLYIGGTVVLVFDEWTGVSANKFVFIVDTTTKQVVDGLLIQKHSDHDFSSRIMETITYRRHEDSIFVINKATLIQASGEDIDYEYADAFVVKNQRFRRAGIMTVYSHAHLFEAQPEE